MRGGVFDQLLVGGNGVVGRAGVLVGKSQEQQHGIVIVRCAASLAQCLQPCHRAVVLVLAVSRNRGQQRALLAFLVGRGECRTDLLFIHCLVFVQGRSARLADQLDQCQSNTDQEDAHAHCVLFVNHPAIVRSLRKKQGDDGNGQDRQQGIGKDGGEF